MCSGAIHDALHRRDRKSGRQIVHYGQIDPSFKNTVIAGNESRIDMPLFKKLDAIHANAPKDVNAAKRIITRSEDCSKGTL